MTPMRHKHKVVSFVFTNGNSKDYFNCTIVVDYSWGVYLRDEKGTKHIPWTSIQVMSTQD
jgi:hypothetical protein